MSDVVSLTLNDTAITEFVKNIEKLTSKMKTAGKQVSNVATQSFDVLKMSVKLAGNSISDFANKTANKLKLSKKNIKDFSGSISKVRGKVIQFAKDSVSAGLNQMKAEGELSAALKQRMNATQGQMDSVLKLTSAQQANGVVSDQVQMAGAKQLTNYVSNADRIKTLIPAMNDLLVSQKGVSGTAEDAAEMAGLMGQGLNGQTAELEKAGISFSDSQKQALKFGNEQEKVAILAKAINDKVGGANKQLANTDAGAIANAKNMFVDLKESIGKKVIPYLIKFAKWFSKNEPAIKKKILSIIDSIITKGKPIFNFLKKIFNTIKKNKKIAKIIGIFVGVFTALAAILTVVNVILGLCPLVWIAVAIAAAIAAIAALILYWDVLKAAAASVWESITTYFGNLRDSVVGTFSDMVTGIKGCWDSIIEFLKNPAKGIIDLIANSETNGEPSTGSVGGKALGTSYWKGGLTHINERGGEIIDLPNGSRVIPADKSEKLLNGSGVTFGNIYITAKGVTASEVVNEIVPRLKLSLANM